MPGPDVKESPNATYERTMVAADTVRDSMALAGMANAATPKPKSAAQMAKRR